MALLKQCVMYTTKKIKVVTPKKTTVVSKTIPRKTIPAKGGKY